MPNGAPVDDVIVYRHAADRYLLVVNAGEHREGLALAAGAGARGLHARGPQRRVRPARAPGADGRRRSCSRSPPLDLTAIAYYHFAEGEVAGHPAIVSRTGYTGEDGFEIFVAPGPRGGRSGARSSRPGATRASCPPGLGARDTLRLEAQDVPLRQRHGRDDDARRGRPRLDRLAGRGQGRLHRPRRAGGAEEERRRRASWSASRWSGRGIARHGYPGLPATTSRRATVTSGTYAPFLQKNIGLVLPARAPARPCGTELDVEIRGRRVPARVVPTPFYKRPR